VARLSGDIFAIICPETSTRGLEAVAKGVAEEMSKPVQLPQGQIRVTASVGAATATGGDSETARDMLRRAHGAMYRAKKAGRNRVVLAQADVITLRPR
jgi:two-component system cell cycle response regulator